MTTTTDAICVSARAQSGNSRGASSSPPRCGRTDLPHAELRRFLGQLFFPKERIWFRPLMSERVFDRCLADPVAMAALAERRLVSDPYNWRSEWIGHRPLWASRARSTTLQSRRFDSIIAHLQNLNRLGYDIHVCPNPQSFRRRCEMTVRGVRSVVLEGGGRDKPKWLDWLANHRKHTLVAVDSGGMVQICIRIPPMRNHKCIEKWIYLPDPDDDTTVDWPEFHDVAQEIGALTQRDGLDPDYRALHDFAGLVRCPGFIDASTGQRVRLLHPFADGDATVDGEDCFASETTNEVDPNSHANAKPDDHRVPLKRRRKESAGLSRRRIMPPLVGQPRDIRFYVKVDAAEVLSPAFRRYADHANYIQHRILMGRMLGDLDETGSYTLLKSDYLRQVVYAERLKPLLDEMRAVGLIERDSHYIVDHKSYGYRFTDRYSGAKTIRVECRRPKLSNRILALRHEDFRHYKAVHKHLFRWLGRLDLDGLLADRVIHQADFTGTKLPVKEMRDIQQLAVQAVIDGLWEFKVCDYGRVHTNITRLLKAVREELRIDGRRLVTIDIANSQPLFLLAAMLADDEEYAGDVHDEGNECVKRGGSKDALGCRKSLPLPSGTYTTSISPEGTDDESFATSGRFSEDLRLYRWLCESGRLYIYLMERMGWTAGKEEFKDEELFRCLYGSNGPRDAEGKHNPSRLQPVLEADFPTVWGFIRAWKRRHGYKDLSCQMQRAESKLMIEGVCGRLMQEHPDCPLVTIHDSIMTTTEWVDVVKAIMLDEFAKLGIKPTLHIEPSVAQVADGAAGDPCIMRCEVRMDPKKPEQAGRGHVQVRPTNDQTKKESTDDVSHWLPTSAP